MTGYKATVTYEGEAQPYKPKAQASSYQPRVYYPVVPSTEVPKKEKKTSAAPRVGKVYYKPVENAPEPKVYYKPLPKEEAVRYL